MKYYTSALMGFIIWGTFALVLKPLSAFGALDILIHRVIFAAISIVIACFLFRRKQTLASLQYIKTLDRRGKSKLLINVVSSAIFLAFNWFSFIYVMNAISVNATSLAYLICPILTTILASMFLNERLNNGQWLAVVLAAISCIILAYGHFMDLFYSMIIALSYAIYLILQKNSFQLDKFFSLTIHIVVSMFLLLPLLSVVDTTTVKTNEFYWLVLIIAVGYTIIPLFMNIFALKGLDSSVVGILMYLNPIISFFLAVFYYHEPINTQQIIAFSMILLAILVFNIAYIYERKRKLAVQAIKHEL
ncbi:EamA family transporter [Sphingobacterium sp.]|uniref:EamA family transporter n=1 Tax=Sphingobacterium sp. TaxID=341027 RepID=UPI00289B2EC7|nr:EamA family transporter [Sphingobacterium sp.]